MIKKSVISFLGLGLIGGSIAKALKSGNRNYYIKVYDINQETLHQAYKDGIADEIYDKPEVSYFQCDFLFLCTPVSINHRILEEYHSFLSPKCILTDVGSVKQPIHRLIQSLCLSSSFIGGHPMAGSERFGYLNSQAGLLENAYYILTPEKEVSEDKIERFTKVIEDTRAIPFIMDVTHHDEATALISHLPHLVASSLVNLVHESDDENATFKTLAAGGFKDITRIASSSPGLWQQICLENRDKILVYLEKYIQNLISLQEKLSEKKELILYEFFKTARDYRDSFLDTRSGPLMKQYVLTIDIPDKKGALAHVVNLLSNNDINIKNIGIVHNREYQEGALRMEFYHPEEYSHAISLLKKQNYKIHH